MKYAVVRTGGKQYRLSEGQTVEVERRPEAQNTKVSFAEVLLYVDSGLVKVGKPTISGVMVEGTVLAHTKGEKIRVSKYKAKVRYRRTTGHRQLLTQIKVNTISDGKSKGKPVIPETEEKIVKSTRGRKKKV